MTEVYMHMVVSRMHEEIQIILVIFITILL